MWVEVTTCSDHSPLFLVLTGEKKGCKGNRGFRYEAKWALDEGYEDVIKIGWAKPCDGRWEHIGNNLIKCQKAFHRWQQELNGDIRGHTDSLQQQLRELQDQNEGGGGAEMQIVKKDLQILLDKTDIQWRQRAKMEWLRCGDRNTRYYHACANARKKSNQILRIADAEGREWESEEEVQNAFLNYFSGLFKSGSAGDMSQCLQPIDCRVTEDMNMDLLKKFYKRGDIWSPTTNAPFEGAGTGWIPRGIFSKKLGCSGGGYLLLNSEHFEFRYHASFIEYDQYCIYTEGQYSRKCL